MLIKCYYVFKSTSFKSLVATNVVTCLTLQDAKNYLPSETSCPSKLLQVHYALSFVIGDAVNLHDLLCIFWLMGSCRCLRCLQQIKQECLLVKNKLRTLFEVRMILLSLSWLASSISK